MVKTDTLKQWAVSLIICAIGGTVISLLSPRGSMEKTLRAVIGIFVVSAICTPLLKFGKTELRLPAFAADAAEICVEADNLLEQTEKACKETVGRVVSDVMASAKIDGYEVETNVDIDENYCIIIQSIYVTLDSENSGSAAGIKAELQKRLGVPVEIICE